MNFKKANLGRAINGVKPDWFRRLGNVGFWLTMGMLPLAEQWAQAEEDLPTERLLALDVGSENLLQSDADYLDGADLAQPDFDAAEPLEAVLDRGEAPASRWKVVPHLDLALTYDDNIFITNRNRVDDLIGTVAPGLGVGFWDSDERFESYLFRDQRASRIERPKGNFVLANYTATLLGFLHNDSENALDHDASIAGQWVVGKVTVTGEAGFQTGSGADIDIGGRVDRKVYTTNLNVSYAATERVTLEGGLYQTTTEPDGFTSSTEVKGEAYANYLATPLLTVGFGGALGRLEVEDADAEVFEQVLVRGKYEATEKVAVLASGGVEFRQSDNDGNDETTPVYRLALQYEPSEETRITLDGFRRVENSAFEAGRDYEVTGTSLSLRRALSHGFFLTLEGGYNVADYRNEIAGGSRSDDYFYVRPGLLFNLARWGNAQVLYLRREDDSTLEQFSFVNQQVEFQLSLSF